jgi:hypothetical protein
MKKIRREHFQCDIGATSKFLLSWQKSSKQKWASRIWFYVASPFLAFGLCIMSWPNRDTSRRHCTILDSILSVAAATLGFSFCWILFSSRNKHYSLYWSNNLSCIESCPMFLPLLICGDSRLCSCRSCLCSSIHLQEKAFFARFVNPSCTWLITMELWCKACRDSNPLD